MISAEKYQPNDEKKQHIDRQTKTKISMIKYEFRTQTEDREMAKALASCRTNFTPVCTVYIVGYGKSVLKKGRTFLIKYKKNHDANGSN